MGPSGKQRKAQLQLKRAIKRGDAPEHPPASTGTSSSVRRKKYRRNPTAGHTIQARQVSEQASRAAQKLQSAFVKLDSEFLDETRRLATTLSVTRPIPERVKVLNEDWVKSSFGGATIELSVPKRPKWRYKMSKAEVEGNEQAYFCRWLSQQDAVIEKWRNAVNRGPQANEQSDQALPSPGPDTHTHTTSNEVSGMPHPPTYFERNIEVWRQLWRVTEMSDIILLLLDSRCPPLHLPPSLASYLSLPDASTDNVTNATRKPKVANVIFVLTKVDIPGPARVAAWTSYLNTQYLCVPVVPIEAYAPKKADPDGPAVQGRVRYKPHIAETFRERLVDVLKVVHAKMLIPPDWIKGSEEKKCGWKPKVRADVDWERVRNARDVRVGRADGAANPEEEGEQVEDLDEMTTGMQNETNSDNPEEISKEPEFLTVGLIGQPNVGKSSLLNALFGTTKVRASRTPGKTKHFQTLFWTPDVRLVDCPGLVMPSFVPIDIQVLCSVFPISRMAAIPFCVHQISQLLPLEDILALTHPSTAVKPVEDKRTWRDGQRSGVKEKSKEDLRWTAVDIMTAYADKNGWVTAKAGRPDVNRAGNAILRLVSQGNIPWAFWPPSCNVMDDSSNSTSGIWLKDKVTRHDVKWEDEDEDESENNGSETEVESEDEDKEDKEGYFEEVTLTKGRFDALSVD